MQPILVPYHLDEYLPALDVPLEPERTITRELPDGDVWARMAALYEQVATSVAAQVADGRVPVVMSGDARDLDPPEGEYLDASAIRHVGVADLSGAEIPEQPIYLHIDLDAGSPPWAWAAPGIRGTPPPSASPPWQRPSGFEVDRALHRNRSCALPSGSSQEVSYVTPIVRPGLTSH